MERERRLTAGKRLTALVGKALEEDETFWGHDTWNDANDDEDNESFHSSDEDPILRKDEFDSDFNDSETDNEDIEQERGLQEESELQKQERRQLKKSNYVDLASKLSRASAQKKQKRKNFVTGEGLNAGIVLNLPSSTSCAPNNGVGTTNAKNGKTPIELGGCSAKSDHLETMAQTRQRRSPSKDRRSLLLQHRQSQRKSASTHGQTESSSSVRKDKIHHTQEELLLEAVHETEPSNERWLLTRKRLLQDVEESQHRIDRLHQRLKGRVIERFVSRRGYMNVVSFPEMDHVPHLLTKSTAQLPPDPTYCVITGKRARYWDPLTKQGYYDLSAFMEIRKRALDPGASTSATEIGLTLVSSDSAVYDKSRRSSLESGDLPASLTTVAPSMLGSDTEATTALKNDTGVSKASTFSITLEKISIFPLPEVNSATPPQASQSQGTSTNSDLRGAGISSSSVDVGLSEERSRVKQHISSTLALTPYQSQLPRKQSWPLDDTAATVPQMCSVEDPAHASEDPAALECSSSSMCGPSPSIPCPDIPVTRLNSEPPPSPRRFSPRRQKPSAKVIENNATRS